MVTVTATEEGGAKTGAAIEAGALIRSIEQAMEQGPEQNFQSCTSILTFTVAHLPAET